MANPDKKQKGYKFVPSAQKPSVPAWTLGIGLVAILVLLAIGAWFLFRGPAPATPPPEIPILNITPPVRNETEECTSDACIMELANQQQNPTLCDLVQNETAQQECFVSMATLDLRACERVVEYETRKECTFAHARNEQSIRSCQRLGLTEGDKKACILTIDSCYYEEGMEQKLCYAVAQQNVSGCGGDMDCIIEYATTFQDPESCGGIAGLAEQYACVSWVRGESVCHDLPDEIKRNYCYELYATKSNQSTLCGAITAQGTATQDEDYQWRCYAYFAIQDGNYIACNSVDLLNRWNCYLNYSLESEDIEGCRAIHEFALITKYNCYFNLATNTANPGVCEDITYAADKERCYSAVIYNPKRSIQLGYCAAVLDKAWREACYNTVAKETQDPSICTTYIEGLGEQQLCQRRVAGITHNSTAES